MNTRWVSQNWDHIWYLMGHHAVLGIIPVVVSLVLSVPLGWWAHRSSTARRILIPGASILYALPSLPLLVLLPLILGTKILDPVNVVVALSLYGIALLVRTATDAFDSVGRAVRRDAVAMGHSNAQVFWRVALPLAAPTLTAGLRVVSASTLSLVSVGALIGVPSLGYFFTDGYQRSFPTEIWVGIVGTLALALIFDLVIVAVGGLLTPWQRRGDEMS
ncbi:ABC transporter permease subunit [Cutibacterium equinum]|uniref:ABC transporter permease subunit n=1 Tax=Cutibacterium equinum TaxID=3016342 RepID=A0ABY7QZ40_9ACTN|nr:ABC transporter permease subunit [Cutibacterium equinum]WCC80303.1 ABC transporter permease subunit [Cutibacterium equinum]